MVGIKRLLILVSPLLIASCALGDTVETVEIDANGRQLQETKAPKGAPKVRSEEGDAGKGKGKGSSDSEDESGDGPGKGKGKGSSGSSKSGKGDGKGGATKAPSSSGGKGKGKGDDEPPSGGKGKGSGSKSSKGSKMSKASKKSKSSKDGGGGMPSAPPIDLEPTTPSPTSVNSIPRRATPYALFYTLSESDERIPSTEEYAQLAEVTRVYLEQFMIEEFSQTSLTNLDDFLTFMVRNSFTFGQPVQADYRSTGLFNPSSIFLPTVRELDELITTAFTDDNLVTYLALVRALPSGNVFSDTVSIEKGLPEVPIPRSSGTATAGDSTMFAAGLASTAAGIVVLAAGLMLLRRKQEDEEDEFAENGNVKKGDSTVAGDTCNMSLDGSSTAPSATWRTSGKFGDDGDDLDEDEFEDEPLDDDTAISMRQSAVAS